ncbi:MAG: cell surface protein SprA, partial [candidate division Zixibacteria bacterium]|nr:cell surface protein SprA [candidate division Zixibacteria bacterium]
LTKEQKQKEGGLLSVNIPLKSKAIESLFGEGGAGLKVSGYHQISFSGSSQWNDQASTATYRQSKFPSLNMEQVSRFDINGTIGSKISVAVSQDSKTDIPLANRIILRYKGEEDDIIKSIEAGNTTLSLPNTQFVGYSSRIQGLFGVKTQAQVGNLTLTAIASQEKGTTERSSITAGAASSKKYLRDYQYAQGKIFDLGGPGDFQKGDVIQTIEVFTSSPDSISIGREANFYVHPDDTLRDSAESVSAYATEYKGSYFVDEGNYSTDSTQHWILFDNSYAGNFNNDIGVRMTIRRANGTIDSIGNTSSEPYKFKLIRRHQPDSSQVTWKYMWRNVYDLGDRNIGEGLQINVFKGSEGTQGLLENLDNQNGRPYIRILGLDKFDQEGKAGPDGLVDIRRAGLIDMGRGLLIFPDRKPFAPDSNALDTTVLSPIVPEIYAYENSSYIPSKYYIEISNQSRSAEISLGRANILEGSERVTLNGRQLVRGQDYNIQYDFGQVTFLTQEAMDPNASINIEYEYSPFIMAEKKTLFGVRGEYQFSDDFKVGSTFLYKSDKATERRPKIGQETARTVVWDADTRFKLRPNFLSKAANILPFYSTEEGSSLEISAEVARSYPNPNVDGVAYLDDFEGGRDPYSLGILRGNWTLSSKPIGLTDRNVRAKMIWYNPYKEVSTETIWDLQTKPGDQGTQTLWLEFNPLLIDRRSNDALLQRIDTVNISKDSTWGGIMRYLPAGAANQQRSQLLEMRLQGDKGIIHIDLGMISEDVNGNNTLDTENKISSSGLRKNFLDPGEDVGLDGLNDD